MKLFPSKLYRSGSRWCLFRWTYVPSGYITRLHIIQTPAFAICLHWLHKPDPEPYEHDHPVSFLSIILKGFYVEQRSGIPHVRSTWNFIRASILHTHRISFVAPGTVTLCFMGPKVREWGYHIISKKPYCYDEWMHWRAYQEEKRQGYQP